MNTQIALFLSSFFLLAPLSLHAAPNVPNQEAPVKPTLVADLEEIEPGIPFRVGVRFKIPAPWHIYWKNPGDAGLPTKITFSAPEGSYVHPLSWPLPVTFTQPGDIVGYGYNQETLFYSEITPPANITTKEFEISAKISWLNCSTVCIPGKAQESLKLKVGHRRESPQFSLFQQFDYPKAPEEVASLFKISTSATTPELIQFLVEWDKGKQPLTVFAYAEGVEVGRPIIAEQGSMSLVKIPLKGVNKKTELEAVFSAQNRGRPTATSVVATLEPAPQAVKP